MTIKELSEKRVKLVADARAVLDKAKTEKRDMTAEENKQYDDIFKDVDGLRDKIDAANEGEKRSKRLEEEERWARESAGRKTDPADPSKPVPGGSGGGEKR